MSTTWGQYTWGSNSWESDQNTITPSGISLSASLGTLEATSSVGWGAKSWGAGDWGSLANAYGIVTGNEVTLSTNSVTIDAQIQIGWGGLAWGEGEWGDLANPNIDVSGIELTSDIGSVTISANADAIIDTTVTGPADIGMNVATDGVVAGTSHLEEVTGEEATSTTGNAFGGETNVVQVTSPSNDPWGNETWGNGLWGVGDGITLLGDASVTAQGDGSVTLNGEQATGSVGITEIPVVIDVGLEATTTVGDAFGGEVVEVQVTTASAQPWGEVGWGDGQWGQSVGTDIAIGADAVLTPSIDVLVTGEQLDWTIGNETVTGDANVTLSGVSAEIFQGDENAFTDVTAEPTGQQLTTGLNDVVAGISQLVIPTGVTATVSTGIMGINAWAVIEPNASTTWSVVDKAAA